MRIKQLGILALGLLFNHYVLADPAPFNSVAITADTMKALPNCLHYKVRGFCTWYSPYSGFSMTPYVEFYSPDLVATVFTRPGENPWMEMNNTLDMAGAVAEKKMVPALTGFDAGQGQHSVADEHEQNTFFKEADIIGNPALTVFHNILSSTAQPLVPYFQSMIDAAGWHGVPQAKTPLVEETLALIADVKHHISSNGIDWGGIYPHEGSVATSNDAKAAAVIAQRAADLTTLVSASILGHIVRPLSTHCGQACTATAIQENSSDTQFQMVYPTIDDSCDYFGKKYFFWRRRRNKNIWRLWLDHLAFL